MAFIREVTIKVLFVILLTLAMVASVLWMGGFLQNERIEYSQSEGKADDRSFEYIRSEARDRVEDKPATLKIAAPHSSFDIPWNLAAIESEIDFEQYPVKEVTATGYTAGIESTGKTEDHPAYGITFSGVEVRRDLFSTVAADLDVFPLGTILYIPGYGYGVVADIGGAIQGDIIDLYYDSVDDVYQFWGKQKVEVYIIKEGDGEVTEAMLDDLNQEQSIQVFHAENE